MAGFDFETNPFHVLGVSSRDGAAGLAEAVEEAVGSGRAAEEPARAAQRALMASKPRLDAELAWFPGVAPSAVSKVVDALLRKDTNIEGTGELPALAQANVAAHLAARRRAVSLQDLVDAQALIDPDATLAAVNGDRSIAGFPRVDRPLLDQGLATLKAAHVAAAVEAVIACPDPPAAAAAMCKALVGKADARRDFVEEVVERYDAAAASRIGAVEKQVHAAARTYGDTGSSADLNRVAAAMKAWRDETEARRLVFSEKKLDEPRSAELFKSVREFAKDLVNKRDIPERAQALFSALRDAFADVPSVADQMDRDVAEMATIVMDKRLGEAAGDLVEALGVVRGDLAGAAKAVDKNGFRKEAAGLPGRLYAGFEKAAIALAGTEHASAPWFAMRQLAVDFTNEGHSREASRDIVSGLMTFAGTAAPREVALMLEKDKLALDRLDLQEELTAALKARRTDEILRIITKLEPLTEDQDELVTLRTARVKIESARRSRRNKAIGWAAVIAAIVIYSALSSPSSPTPTPTQTNYTAAAPSYPGQVPSDIVVAPPAEKGHALSLEELRWCLFKADILKRIRSMLPQQPSDYEVDHFNATLNDWRARCVDSQYYDTDKKIVDTDVVMYATELASQASQTVATWRQAETAR